MRHDPAVASVVIMLRELKMHGMAKAVNELAEQGAPAFEAAQPILAQLLKAETAEREVRSLAYQLKVARFPAYRDLAGFDFNHSEVDEALVRQLHRCEFLGEAHNVVLVGGPGTGKTHIATALGVQAIEHHHRRVRFFSTVELVNTLEEEKTQGKTGQIAQRLSHVDLVILDELGYLPFSRPAHPSLPYSGDRQRQLPVQEQLGLAKTNTEKEGDNHQGLIHNVSTKFMHKGGSVFNGNGGSGLRGNNTRRYQCAAQRRCH